MPVSWLKELRALPLDIDAAPVASVERAINAVEQGGVPKAGETLRALGDAAQRAAIEASRAAAPTQKRLVELRQQLGQLRDEVAALKIGKLPFPTRLAGYAEQQLALEWFTFARATSPCAVRSER